MENAQIIGMRVLIMSVILIIGAIAYKTNVITKDGTKQLSAVELKIVNPLLIFMSYQADFDTARLHGLLWTFLLSVLSFAITIPVATLLKRKGKENFSVERFSCIYSNCGFMGIPLISALFGSDGVLYLTAYITIFNLLAFTHGYMMMKEETDFSAFITAVKSPTIIGTLVGLVCFIANFKLTAIPLAGEFVSDAFQFIADMNTPLAMLIAGATAAQSNLIKAVTDRKILSTAFYKLIFLPAIIVIVMSILPDAIPQMSKIIVCVACACPAATTGTMFALLFDKNAKRCSEIFAITTIFSMATLPIITAFASLMI
jgi:hypothetical protein